MSSWIKAALALVLVATVATGCSEGDASSEGVDAEGALRAPNEQIDELVNGTLARAFVVSLYVDDLLGSPRDPVMKRMIDAAKTVSGPSVGGVKLGYGRCPMFKNLSGVTGENCLIAVTREVSGLRADGHVVEGELAAAMLLAQGTQRGPCKEASVVDPLSPRRASFKKPVCILSMPPEVGGIVRLPVQAEELVDTDAYGNVYISSRDATWAGRKKLMSFAFGPLTWPAS